MTPVILDYFNPETAANIQEI